MKTKKSFSLKIDSETKLSIFKISDTHSVVVGEAFNFLKEKAGSNGLALNSSFGQYRNLIPSSLLKEGIIVPCLSEGWGTAFKFIDEDEQNEESANLEVFDGFRSPQYFGTFSA